MWIYIPDKDTKKEPWVGKIEPPHADQRWWSFEVIRHVEPSDLGDVSLYRDTACIMGLLDHQRNCTLIRPILSSISPGSLGISINYTRLKLSGTFRALLTDLAIEDAEKKQFAGFSFSSEAFTVWYSNKQVKTDYDFDKKSHLVDIEKATTEEIELENLGTVKVTKGVTVSSRGYSSRLASDALFRVKFKQLMDLETTQSIAFSIERLFGFLIGFRGKPNSIKVWIDKNYKVGKHEVPFEGSLELSGVDFSSGEVPARYECLHLNGRHGASMKEIIETFLKERDDFMKRIYSIEFCRFFSSNIGDKFSVVMPIYEAYVRKRFVTEEEQSYMDLEKAFFDYVDNAADPRLSDFAKKHLEVKNRKSPGLKAFISKSIEYINSKGFCFPASYAERIQKRRGQTFHSAADLDNKEVIKFAFEVRALVGLLLLHTLDDLGVDVQVLSDQYHGLGDLQGFFCTSGPFGEKEQTDNPS